MYLTFAVPGKTFKPFGVSVEDKKKRKPKNNLQDDIEKNEYYKES